MHNVWPFLWRMYVWQSPDGERTNQSAPIYLMCSLGAAILKIVSEKALGTRLDQRLPRHISVVLQQHP